MRLFVPLTPTESNALLTLAHAERRRPQDQAALILAGALSRIADAEADARESSPRQLTESVGKAPSDADQ